MHWKVTWHPVPWVLHISTINSSTPCLACNPANPHQQQHALSGVQACHLINSSTPCLACNPATSSTAARPVWRATLPSNMPPTRSRPLDGVHRASCPLRAGGTTLSSPPHSVGCLTKPGGSGRRPTSPHQHTAAPAAVLSSLSSTFAQPGGIPPAWGVTSASGYAPS